MADEVIIRAKDGVGWFRLNRPDALNALTTDMCLAMTDALLKWRDDPDVRVVVVEHAEGRGFCSGGDLRALVESVAGDGVAAREFFAAEYRLNQLIKFYPKPYVALMDGVTMGGGVGVSVHGAYRIVTENTVFAMPETGIGLFPDVGGSWFLPRLPGRIGTWMALTGARLKAADCMHAGIATHYALSDLLDLVRVQIAEAAIAGDPAKALEQNLREATEDAGEAPLKNEQARIDSVFSHVRVEDVLVALSREEEGWAETTCKSILSKAPLSQKVALRQMREGAAARSFSSAMRMEYRLAMRLVFAPDFTEGVRAIVTERDNTPRWRPATLQEVGDEMVDAVFAPLPAGEELRFLG